MPSAAAPPRATASSPSSLRPAGDVFPAGAACFAVRLPAARDSAPAAPFASLTAASAFFPVAFLAEAAFPAVALPAEAAASAAALSPSAPVSSAGSPGAVPSDLSFLPAAGVFLVPARFAGAAFPVPALPPADPSAGSSGRAAPAAPCDAVSAAVSAPATPPAPLPEAAVAPPAVAFPVPAAGSPPGAAFAVLAFPAVAFFPVALVPVALVAGASLPVVVFLEERAELFEELRAAGFPAFFPVAASPAAELRRPGRSVRVSVVGVAASPGAELLGGAACVPVLPPTPLAPPPRAGPGLPDADCWSAVFFATMAAAPSHIVILCANRAGTINRLESRGNGAHRPIPSPRGRRAAGLHPLCPAPRRVCHRAAGRCTRWAPPPHSGHAAPETGRLRSPARRTLGGAKSDDGDE